MCCDSINDMSLVKVWNAGGGARPQRPTPPSQLRPWEWITASLPQVQERGVESVQDAQFLLIFNPIVAEAPFTHLSWKTK